MHIYFNDSSALVKLYVPEIGSGWITSECRRPDVLMVIGDIATVEVPAAFGRAEREERLSHTHRQQALARFDAACAQTFMISCDERRRVSKSICVQIPFGLYSLVTYGWDGGTIKVARSTPVFPVFC